MVVMSEGTGLTGSVVKEGSVTTAPPPHTHNTALTTTPHPLPPIYLYLPACLPYLPPHTYTTSTPHCLPPPTMPAPTPPPPTTLLYIHFCAHIFHFCTHAASPPYCTCTWLLFRWWQVVFCAFLLDHTHASTRIFPAHYPRSVLHAHPPPPYLSSISHHFSTHARMHARLPFAFTCHTLHTHAHCRAHYTTPRLVLHHTACCTLPTATPLPSHPSGWWILPLPRCLLHTVRTLPFPLPAPHLPFPHHCIFACMHAPAHTVYVGWVGIPHTGTTTHTPHTPALPHTRTHSFCFFFCFSSHTSSSSP